MPSFRSELRLTLRALGRARLFTAVAVLSLGLALALNTTLFALVDGLLNPPMPYAAPEQLHTISWRGGRATAGVPEDVKVRAVREGLTSASTATIALGLAPIVAAGAEYDSFIAAVSPGFFETIGVPALQGRILGPADARGSTAVISYGLWRRAYARRPLTDDLVVEVNGVPHAIVGVMPAGMAIGSSELWVPLDGPGTPHQRFDRVILRLRSGVTGLQLRRDLATIASRVTAVHGDTAHPLAALPYPAHHERGTSVRAIHVVLLVTSAVVLLIACANLATLLLARAAARRRETGVRLALGASRGAIVRAVLLECALLVVAGAALGLLLTRWALDLVDHWVPATMSLLGDYEPRISWRVFALVLAVTIGVILLAGLLPAVRASRTPPAEPIKEGGGTTRRRRGDRWGGLVATEVALSTALLMLAVLFVQGTHRLMTHEFTTATRRLVVVRFVLQRAPARSLTGAGAARLHEDVLRATRALAGVRDAASARREAPADQLVTAESGPAGEHQLNLGAVQVVSPTYLRTIGVPVVRGRDFEPGDASIGAGVVIVDDSAARRLWPDVPDPTGRMLKLGGPRTGRPWLRVVGVAQSLPPRPDRTLPPDPAIYVVVPGDTTRERWILVAGQDGADIAPRIRRLLLGTIPNVHSVSATRWLVDYEGHVASTRFLATLFAALAGFALVLCAVGLYGVIAYAVSMRARELSIRVALGARDGHIARDVMRDAAVVSLGGVGVGAFIALAASSPLMGAMQPVPYAQARALVIAEVILFAVAALATWEPLRRAMRTDPAKVLQAG